MKTAAFTSWAFWVALVALLVALRLDARPRPRTSPHFERITVLVMSEFDSVNRVGYDEFNVVMLELRACYDRDGNPRPGTGDVYARVAAHALMNAIDCMRIDAQEN